MYLIFSIFNVVLAAPAVVQRIDEAHGGDLEMGPAENVATTVNEPGEIGPASPPPSPKAVASLEHSPSLGGAMYLGSPTPHSPESSSPFMFGNVVEPAEALTKEASRSATVKKTILKYLAIWGSVGGGAWLFNKLIHGRDYKDS
jgi:hypothetical protein